MKEIAACDEYFKGKHRNHAKNNNKILVDVGIGHWDYSYSNYSCCLSSPSSSAQPLQKLGCPSNHNGYNIICCCDGLSLLLCPSGGYLLWNSSTNESVRLPNHDFSHTTGRTTTYGLGYDSISDDYKILNVFASTARPPNRILGSWKNIDNHPAGGIQNQTFGLAFVQAAFHWIVRGSKYFVTSFNISNETHGEISLPEGISNILKHRHCDFRCVVSAFDEMLCVYSTCQDDGETETLKLWRVKCCSDFVLADLGHPKEHMNSSLNIAVFNK
ncbi:hypothetical protein CQW23_18120 [Capsicum baccatum]|uniref:F-box associated beta-propeller type 1 domain-containing protein n=1 Tax=Capsicum baccatum TaxID=33114 RepID=A0A2G2WFS1_CAPBA|nr:hypothetical protein CQW23_18120 [Capsicum baccatum]